MVDYQNSLNVANFVLLSGLLNSTNIIRCYTASSFLKRQECGNSQGWVTCGCFMGCTGNIPFSTPHLHNRGSNRDTLEGETQWGKSRGGKGHVN